MNHTSITTRSTANCPPPTDPSRYYQGTLPPYSVRSGRLLDVSVDPHARTGARLVLAKHGVPVRARPRLERLLGLGVVFPSQVMMAVFCSAFPYEKDTCHGSVGWSLCMASRLMVASSSLSTSRAISPERKKMPSMAGGTVRL